MKTLLIASCFALCLTFNVAAQKTKRVDKPKTDVKTVIMNLEKENNRALLAGDQKSLENLYADDFVGVHGFGGTTGKDDIVDYFAPGVVEMSKSEDIEIRVFNQTAIVVGIMIYKTKRDEETDRMRYTRVYVLRTQKWQIVSEHYSYIKEYERKILNDDLH